MSMSQSSTGSMQSDINVTPMIDVLLVLLIIFMVIVPVTSRGESAQVPQPAKSDAKAAVVLEVLRDGANRTVFRINQQTVTREELATRLAGIYARRAERILFVKGDDQLSFTEIAEAIDISHAAGVQHVGLITPNLAAGR